MKFVTFHDDAHADAFLALMRRLEKDQSGFWHNRGFILERFRDVVIAAGTTTTYRRSACNLKDSVLRGPPPLCRCQSASTFNIFK